MDQTCLVVPIFPGKTPDARQFLRELERDRKSDYERSERRIGILKETWFLATIPAGDLLVAYMESPDFAQRCRSSLGLHARPASPDHLAHLTAGFRRPVHRR